MEGGEQREIRLFGKSGTGHRELECYAKKLGDFGKVIETLNAYQ